MPKVALAPSVRMTQSMISIRSVKSKSPLIVYETEKYKWNAHEPQNFEEMVTAGCKKFHDSAYGVVVKQDYRSDEFLKSLKYGQKMRSRLSQSGVRVQDASISNRDVATSIQTQDFVASATKTIMSPDDMTVVITAVYDNSNELCEILLLKQKYVTRELMQILCLVASHFPLCTKMSFKNCQLNGYTINEMRNFLPLTSITEVCLDDCPLLESSYALLLDKPCRLNSLSLCRCKIQDDSCVEIASKLHFLEPAEATLSCLNLSSNHITDVGAKSIGGALRTNRHLRYLNLADNRIGDDGANHILRVLIDFPLTYDEIVGKRRNYFGFLRAKEQFHTEYGSDWDTKSMISVYSCKSTARKGLKFIKDKLKTSSLDDITLHFRSEMIDNHNIGNFVDPFTPTFTKLVDGYPHCCAGNMVLCYLNLSYNKLSYFILKKIRFVLLEQSVNKKLGQAGLLRVLIDGNPLPVSCDELDYVGDMLQRNVVQSSSRKYGTERRRKSKICVIPEKN